MPGIRKTKIVILILVLIAIISQTLLAGEAEPEKRAEKKGVNIGIAAWYAWWTPIWIENANIMQNKKFKKNQGMPIVNLLLGFPMGKENNFSISLLYGYYRTKTNRYYQETLFIETSLLGLPPQALFFTSAIEQRTAHKIDADFLFNIRLHKNLKLFIGPKYQAYFFKESQSYDNTPEIKQYHSGGLGIGIATTIPLGKRFALLANISSMSLVGYESGGLPSRSMARATGSVLDLPIAFNMGVSGSLSVAYYIPRAHMTLALGGRVQYLYYLSKPNPEHVSDYDLFTGVNLYAVFNL